MVISVRKHVWNDKVGLLRRRRDRFGPGICNDAMLSETLQFGTFVMLCVYIRYVYSNCDVDVTDLDPEIVMVLCVYVRYNETLQFWYLL